MSYLNGKDVFPPRLLEEIQRYVQGVNVYIPRKGETARRNDDLSERNAEICRRYAGGQPVRRLSEEFYLSTQAIYKILAKNNQK